MIISIPDEILFCPDAICLSDRKICIMRIADGFVLKTIADSYVVVPVGENLVDFSAMITINETGAFIWQQLEKGCEVNEIVSAMCAEFEIDADTAREDCLEFIKVLEENKVVEK